MARDQRGTRRVTFVTTRVCSFLTGQSLVAHAFTDPAHFGPNFLPDMESIPNQLLPATVLYVAYYIKGLGFWCVLVDSRRNGPIFPHLHLPPMWLTESYPTFPIQTVTSSVPQEGSDLKHVISYDYIVVGGGTAGCVLASRLSERSGTTVLLVERGEVVDSWLSRVPLLSIYHRSRAASSPAYIWKRTLLDSRSQPGTVNLVSGKVLGGTSLENQRKCAGRRGWSWEDVLPYFIKSERSLTHGDRLHRGSTGPWQNQRHNETQFQSIAQVLKACTAIGIPYLTEPNVPDAPAISAMHIDVTVDGAGRRDSTFDAFLPQHIAKARNSWLKVCTGAVVRSVQIEKNQDGLHAAGIWVEDESKADNKTYYAQARREVILCSGSFGSPQLLLLSGIGPAHHLREQQIRILKDLSGVGEHLQDHFGCTVAWRCPKQDSIRIIEDNVFVAIRELFKYLVRGEGLFLSPLPEAIIFASSRLLDEDGCTVIQDPADLDPYNPRNIPDIEIMPIPHNASHFELDWGNDGMFSMLVVLLRPKSKGTVRLHSNDPRVRPDCDLAFLEDPDDIRVMRAGVNSRCGSLGKCVSWGIHSATCLCRKARMTLRWTHSSERAV
ncbi:L-sorbose 1-dehydrogenase [Grifola frondosa]|uniref:L-sorbose 1-dehydrogenase n=1 Tax=Grifola frondosa TaxID=5627 RepID=A0A1C7MH65_GRIFR|nr:L-sorbose 1-dehydrogenase [Grifola frondosa]